MIARLAIVPLALALASQVAAQEFVHHQTARWREVDAATIRATGVRQLPLVAGPALSAEGGKEEGDEEREQVERQFPPGTGTGVLPAPPARLERTQSFAYTWAPELTFEGPEENGYTPADPVIAVGPGHVVIATNDAVSFWDRTQKKFTYTNTMEGLLGTPPAGFRSLFDPKVVYDETAQRFYFTALTYDAVNGISDLYVGISETSDPTQGWWVYAIRGDFDNNAVDYEDIGFGARGIYVGANYVGKFFNTPPTTQHVNVVWVFGKAEMLAGQAVDWYSVVDVEGVNRAVGQTIRPVQCQETPPAGLDGMLVQGQAFASEPTLFYMDVWGVTLPADFPSSGPSYSRQQLTTDYPGGPIDFTEPGGTDAIQTTNVGSNLLVGQFRHGLIATGASMSASSRDISRAIGIGVNNWPTVVVATQSDLASSTSHYFYPGIAINRFGDFAVSSGFCGSGVYPSMRGAVIPAGLNVFAGDFNVLSGAAYYNPDGSTLNRWGDYAGAAVDPVGQNFWLYHMYAGTKDDGTGSIWRTEVAMVPRAVFVDGSSGNPAQAGTLLFPYHTASGGNAAALPGNDLVIRTGTYAAGFTLSTPMRVIPDGGVVQIGP